MSIISDTQENNDPRNRIQLPLSSNSPPVAATPIPQEFQDTQAPEGTGGETDLFTNDEIPLNAEILQNAEIPTDIGGTDDSSNIGKSSVALLSQERSNPPGSISPGAGVLTQLDGGQPQLQEVPNAQATQIAGQVQRTEAERQETPYETLYSNGSQFEQVYEAPTAGRDLATAGWYDEPVAGSTPNIESDKDYIRRITQIPGIFKDGNLNFQGDALRNPYGKKIVDGYTNLWQRGVDSILGNYRQSDTPVFDPWVGYKEYWEDVKKNPLNLLKAPIVPILAQGAARYGEAGDGYLGSAAYAINLLGNGLIGSGQTLYNIASGNIDRELREPTLKKVLLGQDLSFTNQSSDEKPLAMLGAKKSPRTLNELTERNVLYKSSPLLLGAVAAYNAVTGKTGNEPVLNIPTDSWGNSLLRYPEFVIGLALDIATPSTTEVFALINPTKYVPPKAPTPIIEAAQGIVDPKKLPDIPDVVQAPVKIEVPKSVPYNAEAEAAIAKIQGTAPKNPKGARFQAVPSTASVAPPSPLEVVEFIAKNEGTVEPQLVRQTLRTPEALTNLAVANGDALPQTIPLNSTRLGILAQTNPAYSNVGLPITGDLLTTTTTKLPELPTATTSTTAEKLKQVRELLAEGTPSSKAQADEIINGITGIPDVVNNPQLMREVQQRLPRELHTTTANGALATREFLRTAYASQAASELASELDGILRGQKDVLIDYLNKLDELPGNVGRKEIETVIPFVPPVVTPAQRLAYVEESTRPMASKGRVFYHGSKVRNLDLRTADAIAGGARGELGQGIYLTDDIEYATDYAKATPASNLPNLEGREFDEIGNVLMVKPTINNPLNADVPIGNDVKQVILEALNSGNLDPATLTGVTRNLNKPITLKDVYSSLDNLAAENNSGIPEALIADAQRRINYALRESGYDAVESTSTQGRVTVAYLGTKEGNLLEVQSSSAVGVGDLLEGATHRYNADVKSLENFPTSSYAKANSEDSAANLIYRATEQTQQLFDDAQNRAVRLVDDAYAKEVELLKTATQEAENRSVQRLAQLRQKDDLMIQHNNVLDINPCL